MSKFKSGEEVVYVGIVKGWQGKVTFLRAHENNAHIRLPNGCSQTVHMDSIQKLSSNEPCVYPVSPQAFKADDGKPNWFLLMSRQGCAKALAGVVRVLSFAVRAPEHGGKGYTPHSWRQVPEAKERYEAALYRHLNKLHQGETHDDESGESHWYHIGCNALFLAELHNEGESK